MLYAHERTLVLRLNGPVPQPLFDLRRYEINSSAYHERGWCAFEHRVSEMKALRSRLCISFPFWAAGGEDGFCDEGFADIMGPRDFTQELERLRFTNGRSDRSCVADLYDRVYELNQQRKR